MTEGRDSTRRVSGQVKWFDPVKGFGFVIADEGGSDILLHANVLRNFGQSSVADGARVTIEVQSTPRGQQATRVIEIQPPEGVSESNLSDIDRLAPSDMKSVPLEPARVKWFDKGKGFGFANIFGRSEDVFIHVEVLRKSGLADLQPGEALAIRVIEGERGRMAAEVCAWELATRPDEEPG